MAETRKEYETRDEQCCKIANGIRMEIIKDIMNSDIIYIYNNRNVQREIRLIRFNLNKYHTSLYSISIFIVSSIIMGLKINSQTN